MKKIDMNNTASIREGIKSVSNRAATLQGDIQKVAYATLYHTKETGDWTLSRELIEGISKAKGVKSNKLTQYFEAMMAATYAKNEAGELAFTYDEGKSASDIDLEIASVVNWFDFKVEQPKKIADIDSTVEAALKEARKAVKQGNMTETQLTMIEAALVEVADAIALENVLAAEQVEQNSTVTTH